MNTLVVEIREARAESVQVTDDTLILELTDGRSIHVPLLWYPRLWYATLEERQNFEIIGDGEYIHWFDVDEDLSVRGILAGYPSGESPDSLKRWLMSRGQV